MNKSPLGDVEHVIKKKTKVDEAIHVLGNSCLVTEVVGVSLFIFLCEVSNFEKAVLSAANATGEKGGDTDSIAFLTGAFCGARNGISQIKKDWIERLVLCHL